MTIKTSQPALYEKMRNRPSAMTPLSADQGVGSPLAAVEAAGNWLKPGRVIRMPVGYALVAGAVVLMLVIGTYTIGYRSGQGLERQRYEQSIGNVVAGSPDQELTTIDPLARRPVSTGHGLLSSSTQSATTHPAPEPPRTTSIAQGNWGAIEPKVDPRTKGQFYYVLATTKPDGAERLANFCRKNGLETYAVPCNNKPSFRWVVAFPGFAASDRLGPRAKEVANQIVTIGRKWKASERGATDLSDFFMDQYN